MNKPGVGWATCFQMSPQKTLAVNANLHKISRDKLCNYFKTKAQSITSGVIILEGGDQQAFYDTDGEPVFRQDSWFQYLFGVKEPGFFGAIDVNTQKSFLFIPKLPDEYQIWCGKIHPAEYFKKLYGVDNVLYIDEMKAWLMSYTSTKIYLLEGINSDSGLSSKPARLPDATEFAPYIDTAILHHALSTVRVLKSPVELTLLQYSAFVASNAHVQVMRTAKPGMMEYEMEALFQYEIYRNGGCRHAAYTSICACGPNAATLHYGHAAAANTRQTEGKDLALLDMGAAYHGYCSDITCTFPLSGKFTSDQRVIYQAVLNAQIAVLNAIRPGVSWVDCHLLAEKEVLKGLVTLGVLHGSVEELVAAEVGAVFFPHGLGHLIGCDVHDVGGYIDGTPERPSRPGLKKLRTARTLEANMVLTVEPGCYFIDYLLDAALADPNKAKYINSSRLESFRGYGGVRLEDDVVVTETGVENYTLCPRTTEEVEAVMVGGPWPPSVDHAPELRRMWVELSDDCQSMTPSKVEVRAFESASKKLKTDV